MGGKSVYGDCEDTFERMLVKDIARYHGLKIGRTDFGFVGLHCSHCVMFETEAFDAYGDALPDDTIYKRLVDAYLTLEIQDLEWDVEKDLRFGGNAGEIKAKRDFLKRYVHASSAEELRIKLDAIGPFPNMETFGTVNVIG